MHKITFLPHTADLRMKIEGESLEELFTAGLMGISQVLKKDFCRQKAEFDIEKRIKITSVDATSLLVDFLSEVLFFSQTEKAVFCKVKFHKFAAKEVEAVISGCSVESFVDDLKAVTYHEANVVRNKKGNLETMIVFDI